MLRLTGAALALVAVAGAAPLAGQERPREGPLGQTRFYADLGFDIGQAAGEFNRYVDAGFGLRLTGRWRPSPSGPLGLHASFSYLIYGSTVRRYPLVPGVDVRVRTNNDIAGFHLGPSFHVGGGALQLYASGSAGISYFSTRSSAEGTNDPFDSFASSTNFDDFTFATQGGGGLLIRLRAGTTPLWLDLGVRYQNNGTVKYVTEDGLSTDGTTLFVSPIESQANLVVYHIGVSVGMRRGAPKALAPQQR
jgi:hypothetical protein